MAGFEDLIRGTLLKHGDKTPESRAAIYHSSRQALERMLSQNQNLDLAAQTHQRQRLENAIASIEASYAAAAAAAPGAATTADPAVPHAPHQTAASPQNIPPSQPQPQSPPPPPTLQPTPSPPPPPPPIPVFRPQDAATASQNAPGTRTIEVGPGVEPPRIPVPPAPAPPAQPGPEINQAPPSAPTEPNSVDAYSEAYDAAAATRDRKPYAKLLLWTIILVGLGVGVWWAMNFGPAFVQQQLGGSVPNPGQTIESGGFAPGSEDQWVTAFSPGDDSINIDTGGRGSAEVFQNPDESFVRLASNAGGTDNNLKVLIPRGIMLSMVGEAATVEVQIKSAAKTNHQFAVYCEFGSMGTCGRKRFAAGDRVEAQIFDVILNNVGLAADEDAYLTFNTDLGGEGRAIDIYAIRFRLNK